MSDKPKVSDVPTAANIVRFLEAMEPWFLQLLRNPRADVMARARLETALKLSVILAEIGDMDDGR